MKQVALEGFLKNTDISKTIATTKMELFVALVSSFQLLTNFTKNPNKGAMGVLNPSTIAYSEICAGDQIKNSKTVVCNFSKDTLHYRLMNYLNPSSDCICILYPLN